MAIGSFSDRNSRVIRCPIGGETIRLADKARHLRACVIVRGGKKICTGMKTHPRFKKYQSEKKCYGFTRRLRFDSNPL